MNQSSQARNIQNKKSHVALGHRREKGAKLSSRNFLTYSRSRLLSNQILIGKSAHHGTHLLNYCHHHHFAHLRRVRGAKLTTPSDGRGKPRRVFLVIKPEKKLFLEKIKPVHVYTLGECVALCCEWKQRLKHFFFRCHVPEMVAHGLHTDARARCAPMQHLLLCLSSVCRDEKERSF